MCMGIRILVVEDEAAIADFLAPGLREEGYTVEVAADGINSLHRLARRSVGRGGAGLVAAGPRWPDRAAPLRQTGRHGAAVCS